MIVLDDIAWAMALPYPQVQPIEMAVYQKPWMSLCATVLPGDWPIQTATQLGKRLPPSVMVQSVTSLPKVCWLALSWMATSPIFTPPAAQVGERAVADAVLLAALGKLDAVGSGMGDRAILPDAGMHAPAPDGGRNANGRLPESALGRIGPDARVGIRRIRPVLATDGGMVEVPFRVGKANALEGDIVNELAGFRLAEKPEHLRQPGATMWPALGSQPSASLR